MSAFQDAAALFDLFVRSDWSSIHVADGTIELFASRTAGQRNPMLGEAAADEPTPETGTLTAPHVGTLAELVAVGSAVAEGARYGTIEILGERSDLVATQSGRVLRHIGRAGDLVEYDQPLVAIG